MINPLRRDSTISRSALALGTAAAVFAGGLVAAPNASAQEFDITTLSSQEDGSSVVDFNLEETEGEGSSDSCIATGLGVGLPLLLLIPAGLASQLGLAGSSALADPINAAIQDANTRIQSQIGLLDPNAAQAVESLNEMLAPFGVTAGQAAIGVGMVAAGVAGTSAILDACGGNGGSSAVLSWWGQSEPEPTTPESTTPESTTPEDSAGETTDPSEDETTETTDPSEDETTEPTDPSEDETTVEPTAN